MGSVARHQTAQRDIPSSQGLHRLEPLEESLTARRSLKPPRGSKSIAGRDVAALDWFGGLACQTMEAGPNVQRAWQVLLGCPDVGLMVIGDDGRRLGLGGRPNAPEECLSGGQVPPLTKQYVDDLAVLIDGAVEVPLDGAEATTGHHFLSGGEQRHCDRRAREDGP